ncbi:MULTISPECIES: extracellular solute-binding protein [Pseudanabaena]|uniref:Extracellular solute-binding protein family 1 n=2 Tax=Pseudanabaena TaxID=1152 RepID=L8N084_9CYAN|nr:MULTISPECIES: extracellular solute-binding protein [Pseudanabaena]ELS33141.1 extracellular solute-binding protein family 1 [Pseudanabaena biceps PCC 7429]MDG3494618.1 extracellular solute-binding protein [Pseudanabaena catenata USMAC16]
MDRRKFLVLSGATIAGLGGCQWSNPFDRSDRLRVLGLLGAIPSKLISQFESASQIKTEFKAESLPAKLWQELQNSPNLAKEKVPQLVSLGDSWLDPAIAQSLVQPIAPNLLDKIPQWQKLSPFWQQSVTRNNQVWGVPYRWGATAIAYRSDKLKFDITQWSDLWRPELKQKLSLPDDAREVIGLVLKKMGQSYQVDNLAERKDIFTALIQDLKSLSSQVLTYSSDNYLQSLLNTDTLAAVGWTSDMYKTAKQNPNLKVVIPQDGTALWSDIWVIPKGEVAIAATAWMNFCLTPEIAIQLTSLTDAVSPSSALDKVPNSVKADPIKFFSQDILAKSELILPLSPTTLTQYKDLWTKLRSGTL